MGVTGQMSGSQHMNVHKREQIMKFAKQFAYHKITEKHTELKKSYQAISHVSWLQLPTFGNHLCPLHQGHQISDPDNWDRDGP
jgi:hypothetical protein